MSRSSERVRFLQQEIGITGLELAEVMNVSPVQVSRWKHCEENANPLHLEAMDRVIEYVQRMKVSLESRRIFTLGYLRGAARG